MRYSIRPLTLLAALCLLLSVIPIGAAAQPSNAIARTPLAQSSTSDVFVALQPTIPLEQFRATLARPEASLLNRLVVSQRLKRFLQVGNQTILRVELQPGADPDLTIQQLSRVAGVAWAAPNLIYTSDPTFDPREYTPNDTRFVNQYHHTLMQNSTAWNTTEGQGQLIAIFDDGIELSHPDLSPNIWVNDDPQDGIDNDGNGYIDDTNGWATVANTRNLLANGIESHGTHVAGIAAARTNNGLGVAGTAGRATILPIRFYGENLPWTSAIIAESIRYAVDNGAKITNMSYNSNNFPNDPVVLAALSYAYERGVLMFHSAGNDNVSNAARQALDQVLFVANTDSNDQKAAFSNYGPWVDLAAPGENILSTVTNAYATNQALATPYDFYSGTSMASPNAAGVAALIWAANPTWSRDQVAAYLIGTTDSIEAANPSYVGQLGRGRVNAARGVDASFQLAPPRIQASGLPAENTTITTPLSTFALKLPSVLSSTTVISSNFELRGAGSDATLGTSDDLLIDLAISDGLPYQIGTNQLSFTINTLMTPGVYRFTARSGSSGLRDPFGQQLDGDSNGSGGDDFTRTFTVGYQLYGRVFEDWNNNGSLDTGEPAIANQTIWLDLNSSGSLDSGDATTTSDTAGLYAFSSVTPGATTLHINQSTGLLVSTPASGSTSITMGSNTANQRVDVGLYRDQAIYGYLYNDSDGDGNRENNETGFANWTVFVDLNQNSTADSLPTQAFTNTNALAIPDNNLNGITSTLAIANVSGQIADLNVLVELTHTYVSDLSVVLTAPDGQQVSLIARRGGSTSGTFVLTFDDQATVAIAASSASLSSGSYRPEQALSTLLSSQPTGNWRLHVNDVEAPDSGTLVRWGITMQLREPQVTSNSAGGYVIDGLASGSYTLRQITQSGWQAVSPASGTQNITLASTSLFERNFGNQIDTTPPTVSGSATFTNGRFNQVQIDFSEPINGLTLSDLVLRRNGVVLPWSGTPPTLTIATDRQSATLTGLGSYTAAAGSYTLELAAGSISDDANNLLTINVIITWEYHTIALPLVKSP
ncbi:MAG: hypothetical protein OHK0050_39590 [Roseiflexaceae bacterium]